MCITCSKMLIKDFFPFYCGVVKLVWKFYVDDQNSWKEGIRKDGDLLPCILSLNEMLQIAGEVNIFPWFRQIECVKLFLSVSSTTEDAASVAF